MYDQVGLEGIKEGGGELGFFLSSESSLSVCLSVCLCPSALSSSVSQCGMNLTSECVNYFCSKCTSHIHVTSFVVSVFRVERDM